MPGAYWRARLLANDHVHLHFRHSPGDSRPRRVAINSRVGMAVRLWYCRLLYLVSTANSFRY